MATVTWIGKKQITRAVKAYTVGGTLSGTFGLTINGKTVSITGTGVAGTTATALQVALAASTEPEFSENTFTVSGSVVTITGPVDGAPITVATSVSGGATLTLGTNTTATSPNDLSIGVNYDTGAIPANSDTLVFPFNSADVLYNLDALSAVTGLIIQYQFGGPKIGLQDWKKQGYREYRPTALLNPAASLIIDLGNRNGYRELRFDLAVATTMILVTGRHSTAAGSETLEIIRPGTVTAKLNGGSIAVSPGAGGSLNLTSLFAANATASVGTGITVTTLDYLQAGGFVDSSFTTLRLNGGTVEVRGTATGTPTVDAGLLSWKTTGALANAIIGSGGAIDTSAGVGTITVTGAITRNEGGIISDPTMRFTRPYSWKNTRTGTGLGMNLGEHLNVTIADFA